MSADPSDKPASNAAPVGLDKGIERLENRRASKEERRAQGVLKGQRVRGWTEKLLTRTLSGIIYVIVIILCLILGVVPTALLLAAMAWLCCSEFFRICRMAGRRPNEIWGLGVALTYPLLVAFCGERILMALTAMLIISISIWYVFNPRANIADVGVSVFGPVYTSFTLSCIVLVRAATPGIGIENALLSLIVIGAMWAEDSMAYLIGSAFGAHKMAPRISPNKSWEGFFGGLVGCLIIWCVGAAFHVCGLSWPLAIICGLCEGVVSVMGDLFESRVKRGVGVKDSGNLLPGHGGLLDRMDSVLFGGTVAYFILLLGGIL